MNQYPRWAYLAIGLVLLLGTIYALPNVYGSDPALQLSARRAAPIDAALIERVGAVLSDKGVTAKDIALDGNRVAIRFASIADRKAASDALEQAIGEQYVIALNLLSAMPRWLAAIGGKQMYMGLDLRGGVHFLMQVDTKAVIKQTEDRFVAELRTALREAKVRYKAVAVEPGGGVGVQFDDAEALESGRSLVNRDFPDLILDKGASTDTSLRLILSESYLREVQESALEQNLTTLRNRVNELGVAEPVIQRQGATRIVVELPGIEDPAEAKEIIGSTATLEFRMVDLNGSVQDAVEGRIPVTSALFYERNGGPVLLNKRVMLTGESIIDASSGLEQQSGQPAVFVTLDGDGGRRFRNATRDEIGKPMAVLYIEHVKGKPVQEVISIATIRDQLGQRFQITGLDSADEARNLALLLRAGALAAPIEIVQESTVGPSLGQDNIDVGLRSVMFGLALVVLFMLVYYQVFGLIANIAVTFNLVLLVALLSALQATLSMPGIAGIALTIGMAVDANVLINERIREELRNGNTPQASIFAGYERAFSSIADGNLTTLIAGIVLFNFGTGPVRGFAVTLCLGIVTSMFTAIWCTRALVNLIYGGNKRITRLAIG
ncbi:MAG: protein translocase subunit SecD [Gammaproteobacteria bacterium]|nr:protein translocase subunit SecD [Gammaproteobacteria bacterium]